MGDVVWASSDADGRPGSRAWNFAQGLRSGLLSWGGRAPTSHSTYLRCCLPSVVRPGRRPAPRSAWRIQPGESAHSRAPSWTRMRVGAGRTVASVGERALGASVDARHKIEIRLAGRRIVRIVHMRAEEAA